MPVFYINSSSISFSLPFLFLFFSSLLFSQYSHSIWLLSAFSFSLCLLPLKPINNFNVVFEAQKATDLLSKLKWKQTERKTSFNSPGLELQQGIMMLQYNKWPREKAHTLTRFSASQMQGKNAPWALCEVLLFPLLVNGKTLVFYLQVRSCGEKIPWGLENEDGDGRKVFSFKGQIFIMWKSESSILWKIQEDETVGHENLPNQ